jgi:aspartokinase
MASTSLAKRPASFMREHTQAVRDHSAAMARVTDQYVAALKRAEAQYFEGVKRITEAVTAATEAVSEQAEQQQAEPAA